MGKLSLYLNDDQYGKLSILAERNNMEAEEYANDVF